MALLMRRGLALLATLLVSCEPGAAPPPPATIPPPPPESRRTHFEGTWLSAQGVLILVQEGPTVRGRHRGQLSCLVPSFQATLEGEELVLPNGIRPDWVSRLQMTRAPRIITGMNANRVACFDAEWIGPPDGEGVPALISILKSRREHLTAAAVTALASAGPAAAPAIPALLETLRGGDRYLELIVEQALRAIGPASPSALPALHCLLKDTDPRIRRGAADVMAGMGPTASGSLLSLVQALEDEHPGVRYSAAFALSRVGKAALGSLMEAVLEEDPVASQAALDALRLMGPAAKDSLAKLAGTLKAAALRDEVARILDPVRAAQPRSSQAVGGEWPQWRGPRRDNVSTEKGLLREWPVDGPPTRWEVLGLGQGIAGPAVSGGRVYTLGYLGSWEYVTALDERSGQPVWTVPIGPAIREDGLMRWLCQRTPTVDGNFLYAVRADGTLVCLRTFDGRIQWMKDYRKEFGTQWAGWGLSDYPLVDADRLIVTPGGTQATIAALDKVSGEVIWRSVAPGSPSMGHSATVLTEVGGMRQYVALMNGIIAGFGPGEGRVLWSFGNAPEQWLGLPRSTPIVLQDGLLLYLLYSHNSLIRLKLSSEAKALAAKERYSRHYELAWCQDSAVVVGSRYYSIGSAKRLRRERGNIVCIDVETGEPTWEGKLGSFEQGSLTYADGHLYVLGADGEVALIDAAPDRCVLKSLFKLEPVRRSEGATNPVIAGGALYLRVEERLVCFDVRATGAGAAHARPAPIILGDPGGPRSKGDPLPPAVFVPTPRDVVKRMMDEAGVRETDTVYDLGSGDGRILIEAGKERRAKAVGFEIEPALVRLSRERVSMADVDRWVRVEQMDLFKADLEPATVVAVYLPSDFLERLRPQFDRLKPGSRIVSHQFKIPGVPPDKEVVVESSEDGRPHTVYVWTTPLKESGK